MDYVDIYASHDDRYDGNFFIGNPAGHKFLEDDSNSAEGIPDDWSVSEQLRITKRGAFVVIITNVEIDVAICGTENPSEVAFIRVRVPTSGIAQYSARTDGSSWRVFVRRSA